ncbi:MAG: RluA family pseudouridine synthase [Pseudomonadota bacterium]
MPASSTPEIITLAIAEAAAGQRLDKALAEAAAAHPGLSRSRLAHLIAEGALSDHAGRTVTEPRRKVKAGETFRLSVPPPAPAEPLPEPIPLDIAHEDADLIVVNKPAGMVVHPAPGAERGTLVNALLAHCGDSLQGIGGAARPGIVHRIDKDTSGLLVVAKSQAAHAGLSARFAAHDIDRLYRAICWGRPDRGDPRLAGLPGLGFEPGWIRIETGLDRHPADRKRMAVRAQGRQAVTRLQPLESFGPAGRPLASLIACRLETGRTHQIRVHASHIGHPLVGDPVYGRARAVSPAFAGAGAALSGFPRQALHAARLGFVHPVTGGSLEFDAPDPTDFCTLLEELRRI